MMTAPVTLPASIDPALASAARRLVDRAGRIVIFAHQNPDADALGSGLGLAHALHGLGKTAIVACPDPAPEDFASFLPGLDTVVTELDGPPFDLVVALDAGEMSRYGDLYSRYADLLRDAPILNMDHHVTSQGCGEVNIIDTKAAATAELLTLWLTQEGIAISHDAARCLLAGIITDTRAFEFDATTARTMLVGSYLMSLGAVPLDVIKPIYRMRSLPSARLFGLSTATLGSDVGGRLTWAEITPAMWEAAELPIGGHDGGISNFLIDITGVEIAILFRQLSDDTVRLSIRTADAQDATVLAGRFGGGGHPRAAGCTIHAALAEAKTQALAAAREQLEAAAHER
jgi:bifunctional oligoribonuclease and PAP phosphatase NrnA